MQTRFFSTFLTICGVMAFVVIGGLFHFSCQSTCRPVPQSIRLTATKKLDEKPFRLLITNSVKSSLEYLGNTQDKSSKITIGAICEAANISRDSFQLKLTYDSLMVELNNKGVKTTIDATRSEQSFDPAEKILSSIIGSSIVITFNGKNELIGIKGNDEFVGRVREAIVNYDPSAKMMVNSQLDRLAGTDFVKNQLSQLYKVLPDRNLHIGDEWADTATQTSDVSVEAITKYRLAHLSNELATIKVESALQSIPNTTDPMSGGYTVHLKGKQKGTLQVDTKTGLLSSADLEADMEGPIEIMGTEGLLTISTAKKLKVSKR